MDYVRVCAIDAGTRNFAWCVVDNLNWKVPLHWKKEDLWAPKPGRRLTPTKEDIIDITVAWARTNWQTLDSCDVVVLEKQIRTPFIVMNTVLNTLFYDRCVQVHPMTVGSFFKLPKKRIDKKAAGIRVVNLHADLPVALKTDDLADAWLMAVYLLIEKQGISKQDLRE